MKSILNMLPSVGPMVSGMARAVRKRSTKASSHRVESIINSMTNKESARTTEMDQRQTAASA